jgi:NADPH-dependent ferric siderophore reductase
MPEPGRATPIRRAPPPFRRATVQAVGAPTPRLAAVTLAGPELVGWPVPEPAASVRLLVPRSPGEALEVPRWTGNEFLYEDGARPPIRTLTPLRVDPDAGALDVEIVLHGDGPVSGWGATARAGDEVAVSGPGRGYAVDGSARRFLLAGDESAVPAIAQLLAVLPSQATVDVVVEAPADGRRDLPEHPGADVRWCDPRPAEPPGRALVDALVQTPVDDDARIWVAGEAAAVQRIRRHLFEQVGVPRARAVVRGYWKHGRRGE